MPYKDPIQNRAYMTAYHAAYHAAHREERNARQAAYRLTPNGLKTEIRFNAKRRGNR
jgi:hypothetical protein